MTSSNYSTAKPPFDNQPEYALLVGVKFPEDHFEKIEESMMELKDLTRTAGAKVVDVVVQSRDKPDYKYFIGKGKLTEIDLAYIGDQPEDVNLVIFNHELTPAQIRNVEKVLEVRVITRTELILDIFAIHARTKTSKLQVELAQIQYQLPRIVGKGIHMSRLEGRIGMRGPGEQQLEYDRRYLRKREHIIRQKLKNIEKSKSTQRKRRQSEFKVAIIGYTNSGKSTLLNRLVKAGVQTENKLFATLDTTTRKLWLGDDIKIVITDTVGFIRDIPHSLIESFRSTFEDTLNADLLLHVVDITSSSYQEKIDVVNETLLEMGGENIPSILCFNKIDAVEPQRKLDVRKQYPEAIYISAKENTFIEELKQTIKEFIQS